MVVVEMKEELVVIRVLMEKMKRKGGERVLYLELELKEKEKELGLGLFLENREVMRWLGRPWMMGEGVKWFGIFWRRYFEGGL